MKKLIWIAVFAFVVAISGSTIASADGAATYGAKCAGCHGATGAGTPGMAPGLAGSDFIGGDAAAVAATIHDGRSGGDKKFANLPIPMPAFGDQLSAAEIDAIVAYLKGL